MAFKSFRAFCESYFPHTFSLAWSPDHLKVIAKIEESVLHGGLFAMAMPRGSGKSSLCEMACLWSALIGARRYAVIIGADASAAEGNLESIRTELETNDLLLEDWPEVCYPIRKLEGVHQRKIRYDGELIHYDFTSKRIILPALRGSQAGDAVLEVAGITARLRGRKYKRQDGSTARPELVLLDDPQTDESAKSPQQCADLERIVAGAVLGMAGPGKKIAGLMTVTAVCPDDLAERVLDRSKHPQWQGERTKLVYAFPKDTALWEEYAKVRRHSLANGGGGEAATTFYRERRAQMDDGSEVAWPQRHNPDELSAIQHAMNLKIDNEEAFFAEYQNEPKPRDAAPVGQLRAETILAKTNGMQRGEVPAGVGQITAFIDVQQKALFWMVCGWEDGFGGYILDYGCYPEQGRKYFTLADVRLTLQQAHPGKSLEGVLYGGLEKVVGDLARREFVHDDGTVSRIGRCLIDANWGKSTDTVYLFCRQSPHAAVLMPSHGKYIGASSMPFSDYTPKKGDRAGVHWRIPAAAGRIVRHVLIDTNWWKSFVTDRLALRMGDKGSISLFAGADHRMLADQLTAEYAVQTQGRGRLVDEWKIRVSSADNHWFDCLVGCAVGASMLGVTDHKAQTTAKRVKPRKRVDYI